jgi:hypothetical protein
MSYARQAKGNGMTAETFTPKERAFLRRRVCAWCEIGLLSKGCGDRFLNDSCDMAAKRRDALKTYKPRPNTTHQTPAWGGIVADNVLEGNG